MVWLWAVYIHCEDQIEISLLFEYSKYKIDKNVIEQHEPKNEAWSFYT